MTGTYFDCFVSSQNLANCSKLKWYWFQGLNRFFCSSFYLISTSFLTCFSCFGVSFFGGTSELTETVSFYLDLGTNPFEESFNFDSLTSSLGVTGGYITGSTGATGV